MPEIPSELLHDRGWRGALYILMHAFPHRLAVWRHVDLEHREIRFEEMLGAVPWSSTEAVMLQAAWSLFNWDCKINLYETLVQLDMQRREILRGGIEAWLGTSWEWQGSQEEPSPNVIAAAHRILGMRDGELARLSIGEREQLIALLRRKQGWFL